MSPTMMLFVSLAVLLTVLLAVVVIVPWLRPNRRVDNRLMTLNIQVFEQRLAELETDKSVGDIDQALYDAQVADLQRQLIAAGSEYAPMPPASVKSRFIIIVWVVILAVMAYLLIGNRTPVFTLWMATDSVGQVADDLLTGKIDTPPEWATQDSTALISAMQVNVHHHAHDPNRWMRMSELFMSLEAPKEAIEALSRAHRLDPGNQDIASTYAQIRFFSNDGKLDDITRDVLARLLTQNPKHEGAQMLMAMGETRAGNHAQAKAWVMRLRSAIAAKSGDHSAALASLDEMMQTIDNQAAAQSAGIRITVSVAKDKLAQVSQGDSLFVTVRDVAGGAPYAALRLPVSEIVDGSVVVTLSDNHAMMPGRTISQAREDDVRLSVTARISKSGNATPTTGDLSANPVLIATNQNTTVITINQVVP